MRPRPQAVAGLILAAGESRRMGQAKALLDYGGRSFLAWGVALLRAVDCAPIVVVEGAHPLRARAALTDPAVAWADNPRWPAGPLSSLQVGLRLALALHPELDAVFVHHVERPRVRPQTLQALLRALAQEPDCCWQPCVDGRSGHPLLLPRAAFSPVLNADPKHETLRTILRAPAWSARRRKLDVDDPGVLDNIDTPEDLARLPPLWQEFPDG